MTEDNKRDNIRLFVEAATSALEEAELLLGAGKYKAATSRAYYSALNHARALLLTDGIEAKTHGGVQHLISQEFVRRGRFDPAVSRLLQRLESDRLVSDYDAAAVYTREMAEESLADARRYGEAVRGVLRSTGYAD